MRVTHKHLLSRRNLLLLAMLAAVVPAQADRKGRNRDDHDRKDRVYEMRQKGEVRPLAEILAKARAEYPGKVLDMEFEDDDGSAVYEIYILQSGGRVLEVKYDARTGAKISAEEDD